MENAKLRRPLLVGAIVALSLTAIIAIVALLAGDFDDTQLRVLATTGGFGLSSLIAMCGTALLDQRRHIALGRAVISLSALSFLIELWILWLDDDSELAWKSYVCSISVAVATAQIAGMLGRRRATDSAWIPRLIWAAGTAAVVVAAMSWAAAIGEISRAGYYRALGAVVVLNVFSRPAAAGAAPPREAGCRQRGVRSALCSRPRRWQPHRPPGAGSAGCGGSCAA